MASDDDQEHLRGGRLGRVVDLLRVLRARAILREGPPPDDHERTQAYVEEITEASGEGPTESERPADTGQRPPKRK